MQNTEGAVALITGASGGIGRAIALELAQQGMRLALCGRRADRLREVAGETGRPEDMLVIAGDLTDENHLKACVAETLKRFGRMDVLVNNAGMALNCSFEETTTEMLDSILSINVRTPFLMCREALPALRESKGVVINIGSAVAHNGYAQQAAYTASKHALLGLTKSLAKEVWQDGVRVHVISPGGVATDMIRIARPDLDMSGMILPEEVARIAAWLIGYPGNAVIDEIQMHRPGKEPFLS